jgi:type IV pilus assembly protein PilM
MTKRVVGLDIGSHSIKVVHLEPRGRGQDFDIVYYNERKLEGVSDPRDEEALRSAQLAVLTDLKNLGIFDGHNIVTALPASQAQMRTLPVPFNDKKKIEAVIPGMLDTLVPFDTSELAFSWFLHEKKLASGEYMIALAYTRKTQLEGFLAFLSQAGIDPRVVTFKPAPLLDLFAYQQAGKTEGLQALVDVGHTSTSIALVAQGELVLARSILYAGFDITRQIGSTLGLSIEEAEKIKLGSGEKHAQASSAIHAALEPVVRELRNTALQAEGLGYGRLSQVHLFGGSSALPELAPHIGTAIDAPAAVAPPSFLKKELREGMPLPIAATALSFALLGVSIQAKRSRFNFRRGAYGFRGELGVFRSRLKPILIWTFVTGLCFVGLGVMSTTVLDQELSFIKKEGQKACTSVLGKATETMERCVAQIHQQISGQKEFESLQWSAVDVYLELARVLPKEIEVKVTELDISDKGITFTGDTGSFEDLDRIVAALQTGHCFRNIEKGRVRQSQSKVNFVVSVALNCSTVEPGPGEKGKAPDGKGQEKRGAPVEKSKTPGAHTQSDDDFELNKSMADMSHGRRGPDV